METEADEVKRDSQCAASAAHCADLYPEYDVVTVILERAGGGGCFSRMTVFRGELAKRENNRGARIWNGGVVDYDVHCHYPWKRRSTAKVNRGRRGGHVPESLASGGKEEVCRRIRRTDGGGRHSAAPGTHGHGFALSLGCRGCHLCSIPQMAPGISRKRPKSTLRVARLSMGALLAGGRSWLANLRGTTSRHRAALTCRMSPRPRR